ncbi:ABC transporter ATP-binding protein [Pseudonocardia cypriaca]|uniref:Oligopeptide transport system ATP-binding protein n=1 Tax=Pseudonocardia cypriaca TaxID=882449 RepID=A0A543GIU2_9PSEU|nr:ABC transporter ATP-binding protein [Pseudonocardia cypriaca]TQM46001.1 oligopeptide transport system ATP-binding protein [Pseudonocardia cypriaca]
MLPAPERPAPARDRPAPLLSVEDLRVQFRTATGVITPVDGLSFEIAPGETLAVLGESGSGKSVTAQAVMGLLQAGRITGGRIVYDGVDLLTRPAADVRRLRGSEMAMVFQDPLSSLNPVFRVGTQIGEMFRRHRGASRREAKAAAVDLMKRVGIPDAAKRVDDYPHQFSGGMRQRVMIAMAIALDPRLLIADEPTTALDVTVQAQVMALLASLQQEYGMALVLITHDLGVVADVADRMLLMYAGRAAETGPIREVYERPAHPYAAGLMASLPSIADGQDRLTPIPGAPPNLAALPSGCPFHPRCPYAVDRCRDERPQLRPVPRAGRAAACHRAEEVLDGA